MSFDQRTGWLHTARLIYASGGWRAFYRGLAPCAARAVPACGAMFATADMVKHHTVAILQLERAGREEDPVHMARGLGLQPSDATHHGSNTSRSSGTGAIAMATASANATTNASVTASSVSGRNSSPTYSLLSRCLEGYERR